MGKRYVIMHTSERVIDLEHAEDIPAHVFGPFDSAEEATAFDEDAPDDCYKAIIVIVGPDPRDIDANHPPSPSLRLLD